MPLGAIRSPERRSTNNSRLFHSSLLFYKKENAHKQQERPFINPQSCVAHRRRPTCKENVGWLHHQVWQSALSAAHQITWRRWHVHGLPYGIYSKQSAFHSTTTTIDAFSGVMAKPTDQVTIVPARFHRSTGKPSDQSTATDAFGGVMVKHPDQVTVAPARFHRVRIPTERPNTTRISLFPFSSKSQVDKNKKKPVSGFSSQTTSLVRGWWVSFGLFVQLKASSEAPGLWSCCATFIFLSRRAESVATVITTCLRVL